MSRPLPPELRQRLAKIVPLLSSPAPGEAAAAAASIVRMLTTFNLDIHDLTAAIAEPAIVVEQPTPSAPPPPPDDADPWGRQSSGRSIPAVELRDLVDAIRSAIGHRLSGNASGFLESLEERSRRYASVRLSPRQTDWLTDLARQAEGARS